MIFVPYQETPPSRDKYRWYNLRFALDSFGNVVVKENGRFFIKPNVSIMETNPGNNFAYYAPSGGGFPTSMVTTATVTAMAVRLPGGFCGSGASVFLLLRTSGMSSMAAKRGRSLPATRISPARWSLSRSTKRLLRLYPLYRRCT